jgi:hypothetical protein
MFQFVANTLKFDKKPPSVLKTNIDQLVSICIQNEANKHLRIQSLTGLFYLLQFDNLIDQASLIKDASLMEIDSGLPCENNYQYVSQVVWHSLWNDVKLTGSDNASLDEERFFFILIIKRTKLFLIKKLLFQ